MNERLLKEVQQAAPPSVPRQSIQVVAPPERAYSTWIGGSILASLSTLEKFVISKAEYDEVGPVIARTQCIM